MQAKRSEKLDKVIDLINPILSQMKVDLVDVQWQSEHGRKTLRLLIDRENGVDIETCSNVSNSVGAALDAEKVFEQRYSLEVSSPGVERPLVKPADYQRFKGKKARIKTFDLIDNSRRHEGVIAESGGDSFTLETPSGNKIFRYDEVSKAHLIFDPEFGKKDRRKK